MARTPGATNRTARELETAAAHLMDKARLKRKNEKLTKKLSESKKKAK
ncbi:hypothetical protein [Cryobacterium sp. TMT2-10]|nr:hypothetical protein [Cryobacterium sp. TMT2-10]